MSKIEKRAKESRQCIAIRSNLRSLVITLVAIMFDIVLLTVCWLMLNDPNPPIVSLVVMLPGTLGFIALSTIALAKVFKHPCLAYVESDWLHVVAPVSFLVHRSSIRPIRVGRLRISVGEGRNKFIRTAFCRNSSELLRSLEAFSQ